MLNQITWQLFAKVSVYFFLVMMLFSVFFLLISYFLFKYKEKLGQLGRESQFFRLDK